MFKFILTGILASLAGYSQAALACHIGPTPIEVLHRPFFRHAALVRTNSRAGAFAGRTTLASGSASATVSTFAVASDALIQFAIQAPMAAGYLPRGQTSIVSGASSAVASTSAIYSGMNVNLTGFNNTAQLSGFARDINVCSIVDGVSFAIRTVDSLQVQGTMIGMWDIPEAKAGVIKVNTIVQGSYFTFSWEDERSRPMDATIMWEIRRST